MCGVESIVYGFAMREVTKLIAHQARSANLRIYIAVRVSVNLTCKRWLLVFDISVDAFIEFSDSNFLFACSTHTKRIHYHQ